MTAISAWWTLQNIRVARTFLYLSPCGALAGHRNIYFLHPLWWAPLPPQCGQSVWGDSFACSPDKWCIITDSSSRSLKSVLLCNSVHLFPWPTRCTSKRIITVQTWPDTLNVTMISMTGRSSDFIMVAFLIGLQGCFTKIPCYPCLWDTKALYQGGTGHSSIHCG